MGKELGFVSRHIDIDGTVGLTTFACETKVERVENTLVAPSIAAQFPV